MVPSSLKQEQGPRNAARRFRTVALSKRCSASQDHLYSSRRRTMEEASKAHWEWGNCSIVVKLIGNYGYKLRLIKTYGYQLGIDWELMGIDWELIGT